MKCLERFPEPWVVKESNGGFTVNDANGVYILCIGHRDDLHKSGYTLADKYLSKREAEALAGAIAKIKSLLRRPTY